MWSAVQLWEVALRSYTFIMWFLKKKNHKTKNIPHWNKSSAFVLPKEIIIESRLSKTLNGILPGILEIKHQNCSVKTLSHRNQPELVTFVTDKHKAQLIFYEKKYSEFPFWGYIYSAFLVCIIAHCNVFNFHSWVTQTAFQLHKQYKTWVLWLQIRKEF